MATTRDVTVFVGSLRKESFSRKMAKALVAMAPAPLKLEIVEIGQLPLYNQDDDSNPPAASAAFKARVRKADAVLFVTPEYNRGVPGVLKNAIDLASRPYGDSAWEGKPGAIVSVSPGAIGAFAQRAGDAAAGSVHRRRRQALRYERRVNQRLDARVFAEVPGRIRAVDRAEYRKVGAHARDARAGSVGRHSAMTSMRPRVRVANG